MKKLILVLICMLFVSVFVNAEVTLDKTTGSLTVDQGKTVSTTLTITNNNAYNFTNVKLSVVDIASFMDLGDNQIAIGFSDSADTTGFALNSNQSKTITISATTQDDQYLGELTGEIKVLATKADSTVEEKIFRLTVDTQGNIVDVTLDEGDLDDDVYPGDKASFSINVENIAGYDLENLQVTAWIVNIDDGDDIDLKSSKFDLDSSDDEDIDFDFEIPYNLDEDKYDIKIKVKGQDADDSNNDFEIIKTFKGIVSVSKDEDEEVYLAEPSISTETFTCGSAFSVNVKAINIGTDDLDNAYLKLTVEGTDVSIKSTEFDLDSDKYDDREQNVDFLVRLPSNLDKETYQIKILAYTEDDSAVGTVYKTISVNTCDKTQDNTNEDTQEDTTTPDTNNNENTDDTVYLPSGWTTKFFSSENGKTIFWFMGNLALLVIIVYFIILLAKKKPAKK